MKKFVVTVHRWLGFPIGILFIVTFGTGCITAVDELLQRFENSQQNSAYAFRQTTNAEDADILSVITRDKKSLRGIDMPTENMPFYRLSSRGEKWTYAIGDPSQVDYVKTNNEGFFRTVLQLHRNYLLGKEGLWGIEGKYFAVWVGLISLLLSLLGLWVWWPLRRGFKVKDVVPRGKKRKHFYYSHMTSGVITLVAVVLLSLTGAAITYRSIAQKIFNIDANNDPVLAEAIELEDGWESWLNAAYAQMPEDSQLTSIRFPRQRNAPKKTENIKENTTTNRDETRIIETKGNGIERNGIERNRISRESIAGGSVERGIIEQKNNDQSKIDTKPQLLEFRFTTPGDWLGLSRSTVKIDKQNSTLVSVSQFKVLPLNQKLYIMLVPLHTGHNLPVIYTVALLILSLIGTLMVFSGMISFIIKKRKPLKFRKIQPFSTAIQQ